MKKILMLTTVALLGSASLVAAQTTTATENAIATAPVQEDNSLIVLPLVTATADGMIEIRPVVDERASEVLGSQPVTAGANENVRISLTQAPLADSVMAVLVIDGQDVASQQIRLSPPGGESNRGGNENDSNDGNSSGSGNDSGGGNGGDNTNGG